MYICRALSRKTEGNGPWMSWQPMKWMGANSTPDSSGKDEARSY